ncbi:hypothetical protein [Pantoea vagans]|uniref:hypothetical protein n=1 Tax=Pantoea vagans TaxID=470934 RepID=UPI0028E6E284|nr:hypothetical protein [Pantoea vagans]
MKKTISIFLAVIFSLLSLYAIVDIIESIYLISRYENFTLSSLGFIAGKTLFTTVCLVVIFILVKRIRKHTQSDKDRV